MNNNPSSTRILVVEDESMLLDSIQISLERVGFQVTTAQNGLEGLQRFTDAWQQNKPFHLIITDIQMPDMTGTELITAVQEIIPDMPTLVITGFGDKETVIGLMRLGCLDYLDKPFTAPNLLECIENVLEKFRTRRETSEMKIRQLKKEAEDYESQLSYYRRTLDRYQKQFKSAHGTYKNLIQVNKEDCPLHITWRIRQYQDLGGDYFDIKSSSNRCDILVADVSGHDMGASYHTVLLKAFFEENNRHGNDGTTFFNLLNRQLLQYHVSERIVTAIFIRLSFNHMKGEVISAGHPTLIRVSKNHATPFAFALCGDVLGVHDSVGFDKRQFNLKPGDRYFVYTDGVPNATKINGTTGKKQKLSQEGLQQLIQQHNQDPLEQTVQSIWDRILHFCHYKPADDMLLVGFEIPRLGEHNV
jgi:phosphoserine phosphatase RsbU/P